MDILSCDDHVKEEEGGTELGGVHDENCEGGGWCLQIEEDLRYCRIYLSESEIRLLSKDKFKLILTSCIFVVAREYLISLKNKHSKAEGLSASESIKDYLISSELTTNFKNLYKNQLDCNICGEEDNLQHLLLCSVTTHGIYLSGVQYIWNNQTAS